MAEDLDTKKTRGKPKLVPRFAAGTSNNLFHLNKDAVHSIYWVAYVPEAKIGFFDTVEKCILKSLLAAQVYI